MPTQKFWIPGLQGRDEARIAARLRELDGVYFAILNRGEQCAEIDFEDDRITCAEIRAVIAEFGYAARNAS